MYLIEGFIEGKLNQDECEDNIFFGNNFAAVIDGATSSGNIKIDGKYGGKYLSDKIREIIEHIDNENEHYLSSDLVNKINSEILKDYLRVEIKENKDAPSASAIIYNRFENEIISVGDCQALLVLDDEIIEINNDKRVDYITSEVRSYYINSLLASGAKIDFKNKSEDLGRIFIEELIVLQKNFENTVGLENSYSTLNGFTKEIRVDKVHPKAKEVILASDGYPKIKRTHNLTEHYLKKLKEVDPLLIDVYRSTKGFYEGFKSFDDRAYLRIKL